MGEICGVAAKGKYAGKKIYRFMKTFQEWLADRHPEVLDEGWMQDIARNKTVRNFVTGAALAAGGLGFGGVASAAEKAPRPAAAAQDSQSATAEADYDFDDNESIRDAVEEATMKAKAELAKMLGQKVLSGVGRPAVKIDRKARKVFVTVTASNKSAGSTSAAGSSLKKAPSVERRVSRSDF